MSQKERDRRYKERRKERGYVQIVANIHQSTLDVIDEFRRINGQTRTDTIEGILTTWASKLIANDKT